MMALLALGDMRFVVEDDGTRVPKGIGWVVDGLESSRKNQKKVAEKDDDATVTDQGREVRSFTIKFTWNGSDPAMNATAGDIIGKLDPSNPKPGDPPPFAYEHNGLDVAKVKNIRAAYIEKAKGPTFADTGVGTYELTCSSWAKPRPSAGAGTKDGKKFVLGSELPQKVDGFGGNNNTVQFPAQNPPKPGTPKP